MLPLNFHMFFLFFYVHLYLFYFFIISSDNKACIDWSIDWISFKQILIIVINLVVKLEFSGLSKILSKRPGSSRRTFKPTQHTGDFNSYWQQISPMFIDFIYRGIRSAKEYLILVGRKRGK